MSQPSFYIFGVPNGFDLLDGDLAATNYFQNYYNPSKENTKFSIHRNAGDGMITYAYLKYNLTSGRGREGSFFGMALVFTENSCCTDFLKLYRLFDTIYKKIIIADGEILEPTDGTSYIQAKYKITRFNEKKEYIMQKILPNLLSNLNTFADAFIPIDDTFSSNQPDLGVRIPYENADNKKILNALRQYNRLSISPDWDGPEPPPEIPEEVLYRWHREVPELSLYVNKCFQNISKANVSEVRKKANQISKNCDTFKTHTYPKNASDEVIQCYNETKDQYKELYKSFKSLIIQIEDKSTDSSSSQSTPPPTPPTPPTPWWKNPKILGIMGGSLVVIILMIFIGPAIKNGSMGDGNDSIVVIKQDSIIQHTRALISEKKFEDAIQSAEDIGDKNLRKHLRDSAKMVYNQGLLQEIHTQMNTNHYTDAYNNYWKQMYDGEEKINTEKEIVGKCTEYLLQRLNNVKNNKQRAKALRDDINRCEVPIDAVTKKEMIEKLDKIINTSSEHSTTTPSTSQYTIKIWRADFNYNKLKDETGKTIDPVVYTISSSQTIELNKSKRYICQVLHNGIILP